MRAIRHMDTLAYCDGVQVFEGRDSVGGHYVGVWVETAADADRYLVAGVLPMRLREFPGGGVDLRTLLLDARGGGWLLADVTDGFEGPMTLRPIDNPAGCSRFLPDEGFFLRDRRGEDSVVPGVRGGGR